ncbi:pumilio homolog 24 isoform X2 [Nymphaea colorata]|uniref:pumilio homolog 24 isoform X2 n=1 Tax=Nymphaea colorata TaxID=210225 RepID=UPI00129E52DB|nr:pumilio homolog 24 isoform X2 [Nymphaea colorata]
MVSHEPSEGVKQSKDEASRRTKSKELTEERKKKRKANYTLQHELALLWEKMRRRDITKEERSKVITEALKKMKGKIPEIAGSHVSSRVLQTCIKYCQPLEKNSICDELRPHFLTLAQNKYAVHLVNKMLDNASKSQLDGFMSSLSGHVASLLRHQFGSAVVEHAFNLGNATQKKTLLLELYSTEFRLFKGLSTTSEGRLVDLISRHGLQKASVIEHMSSVLQPILKKEIVDHSIVHAALLEFFSIADKSIATDIIEQLSGPILVRMIHTRDGSRIGVLCVKHGTAKERKKIIKGMKGHVQKISLDPHGNMVIIQELQSGLKELILDKNGRRPLLQLLHPYSSRYFSPDDLAALDLTIPSLSTAEGKKLEANMKTDRESKLSETHQLGPVGTDNGPDMMDDVKDDNSAPKESHSLSDKGKKDPSLRRSEILIDSQLAEILINACIDNAAEFLQSNFAKDVIYEVAVGGAGGILWQTLTDKLDALHVAISQLGAAPKVELQEHVFENFHSSRVIRKLILECPRFANTLWKLALKDRCKLWAQGHSCKVVAAYMESSNQEVKGLASSEVQPLLESGLLKILDKKPEGQS